MRPPAHFPPKVCCRPRTRQLVASPAAPRGPHARQLRAWRGPPGGRRADEQCDELALLHSITSSARASSIGSIVIPSAFAVLRLIERNICVGNSIGNSPGGVPRRILSTK